MVLPTISIVRAWLLAIVLVGCGDNLPGDPGGVGLSGNESATCAIDDLGALFCWGRFHDSGDAGGEQGDPVTGIAAPRFPAFAWREVAVTAAHACGIRDDGTLWCWGRNCAGQLGDGTFESSSEPRQVGTQTDWVRVATGGGHSCAIDVDGSLACWGGIDLGQTDCSSTPSEPLTRIPGVWKQVSSGFYSTHALRRDGTLWRWNDYRIDEDPLTPHEAPHQVGTTKWRSIASGLSGVYGVRDDGTLAFVEFDTADEVQLGADDDWSDTIAARDHGCGLKLDGSLWCWGRNDMGQLGTGVPSEDFEPPEQIGTILGWTAVSAGFASSCGVYDGQVYCWGTNDEGAMGIGMPYDHEVRTPTQIGVEL